MKGPNSLTRSSWLMVNAVSATFSLMRASRCHWASVPTVSTAGRLNASSGTLAEPGEAGRDPAAEVAGPGHAQLFLAHALAGIACFAERIRQGRIERHLV